MWLSRFTKQGEGALHPDDADSLASHAKAWLAGKAHAQERAARPQGGFLDTLLNRRSGPKAANRNRE